MDIKFRTYTMTTESLSDPELFAWYYQQMPEERKRKIDRTGMEQDKRLSLAAGILLSLGLQEYGLDASGLQICDNKYGKPYLPDFPKIHFSLSHSGEMAMAAFADMEIGCDVEYQKRANEKLAKRFFCPEEYAWMKESGDELEQKERFYRLWTLKESFVKAIGLGLHLPLDSFCFSVSPAADEGEVSARRGSDIRITQQVDQERYEFEEYRLGSSGEYCAAVCLRSLASGAK